MSWLYCNERRFNSNQLDAFSFVTKDKFFWLLYVHRASTLLSESYDKKLFDKGVHTKGRRKSFEILFYICHVEWDREKENLFPPHEKILPKGEILL